MNDVALPSSGAARLVISQNQSLLRLMEEFDLTYNVDQMSIIATVAAARNAYNPS